MWQQLLYLVCTVEAALVAATLFVLVIAPDSALSMRTKQLYAISGLVLAMGSCYGLGYFLLGVVFKAATARSLSLPVLTQANPQPQETYPARSAPRAVFGKLPVTRAASSVNERLQRPALVGTESTRHQPANIPPGARPPTHH